MLDSLGAERVLSAERDGQRIAVEIKSFTGPLLVSNFHTALGQFLNYRLALEMSDPQCQLYLAVPFGGPCWTAGCGSLWLCDQSGLDTTHEESKGF